MPNGKGEGERGVSVNYVVTKPLFILFCVKFLFSFVMKLKNWYLFYSGQSHIDTHSEVWAKRTGS